MNVEPLWSTTATILAESPRRTTALTQAPEFRWATAVMSRDAPLGREAGTPPVKPFRRMPGTPQVALFEG